MNAHGCEHECGYGSEAVADAGLGCADECAHGFSDLCAHGHVTLLRDLMQGGGSVGQPPIPGKRIKIMKYSYIRYAEQT